METERVPPLSRSTAPGSAPRAPPARVPGSGRPLDATTRRPLEMRFGHDFSAVRIHTDEAAAESAAALSASAYAVGRDVVMAPGRFAPQSPSGRRLLAHELAHVVQARGAAATPARVGSPQDRAEREAEAAGAAIDRPGSAGDLAPGLTAHDPRTLRRQPGPPGAAPAVEPVTFQSFHSSGTSLQGQALGFRSTGGYFMNAVELRFAVDQGQQRYRDLRCRQWSGPEALYVKRGSPLFAPWTELSRGPGTGADDPLPQSVTQTPGVLAYSDSPGPNLGPMVAAREGRPSRVYSVQNFTGWVEGVPATGGGGGPQRITPVVAWNSVMHLADENSDDQSKPPRYVRLSPTGAGQGWTPLAAPQI